MEKKNLFIIFDFSNWNAARSWSYAGGFQIIQTILNIQGKESQIIIIPVENSERATLEIIERNTRDINYQNIVIWYSHLRLSKEILDTLANKSKNMIYVLTESLLYNEIEILENPTLALRKTDFISKVSGESTIISMCPDSNSYLKSKNYRSVFFYGFGFDDLKPLKNRRHKKDRYFTFAGKIYNSEREVTKNNIIKLIEKLKFKEKKINDSRLLIIIFQQLLRLINEMDKGYTKKRYGKFKKYISFREKINRLALAIRRRIWENFLSSLSSVDLIISLPSYFKGLPGRFFEALFVGSRVIIFLRQNKNFEVYLSKFENIVYVVKDENVDVTRVQNRLLNFENSRNRKTIDLNDNLLTSQDLLNVLNSKDVYLEISKIQKKKTLEKDL